MWTKTEMNMTGPDDDPFGFDDLWTDLGPTSDPATTDRTSSGPRAPASARRTAPVPGGAPNLETEVSPHRWARRSLILAVLILVAAAGAGWSASRLLSDTADERVEVAGASEEESGERKAEVIVTGPETEPADEGPDPDSEVEPDPDDGDGEVPQDPVMEAAPPPAPPAESGSHGAADWFAVVEALPTFTLPSDCGLPIGHPESLPNALREYRGGVHEGVDFICRQRGREAVAALEGRVVMANNTYVDPPPADRRAVLETARSLGRTPPWTLAMMFGRFVVIDHGHLPGAGHVVTIYAHLEEIDPAIQPGRMVTAGQRLGEIGNRGTESAGTGEVRPQAIHLHWEVHVDDLYLGAGASAVEVDQIYERLFGR